VSFHHPSNSNINTSNSSVLVKLNICLSNLLSDGGGGVEGWSSKAVVRCNIFNEASIRTRNKQNFHAWLQTVAIPTETCISPTTPNFMCCVDVLMCDCVNALMC
jgi:hypothetical protein